MYRSLFRLIVLFFFLCGCTVSALSSDEQPISTNVSVNPNTITPDQREKTATSDKAAMDPTSTVMIVSSPTVTLPVSTTLQVISNSTPITQCSGKGEPENSGKAYGVPGTLFYQQTNDRGSTSGLFAVGGTPLKQEILSLGVNSEIFVFGVSPNGEWLAYSPKNIIQDNDTDFSNLSVTLIQEDGKSIIRTLDLAWLNSINEPGYQIERFVWGYWLNDHLIFAVVNSKIPGDDLGVGRFYLTLFDPFEGTGKVEVFNHLPAQTGHWSAAFSPNLTHVLYDAKGIRLIEINGNLSRSLWHDENGEFPSISAAKWSPDGSWAVFANRETPPHPARLLLISSNGNNVYEIQNPEIGTFFKNFYWSPNSRYFAFVSEIYSENGPDKNNLLVFDVELEKFVLECPILQVDLPVAELIWSPGSDLIAVSQIEGPLRVLNVSSGSLVSLNIHGVAVGWSNKITVKKKQ